jgi:hypothetical protein
MVFQTGLQVERCRPKAQARQGQDPEEAELRTG